MNTPPNPLELLRVVYEAAEEAALPKARHAHVQEASKLLAEYIIRVENAALKQSTQSKSPPMAPAIPEVPAPSP